MKIKGKHRGRSARMGWSVQLIQSATNGVGRIVMLSESHSNCSAIESPTEMIISR